ncbi:MAG: bifunctional aspartate transaminase/aspartate 4-decarboxylase [Desulfarculaceae bacterium]|nr:bifunctional aspartate transaminase/aspartate 4-decarboxylase [Desulfarculaceae bacterium]MCF8071309.1 bifunctional aspartate transaminase/aspartate 4-decarboxylase [Desulfarculaceae bacterium]MCF8101634.1 bifunctional aspartate transaminase/aspartate 4-decarboxylase [Desulfarculaceae bacterium]MCF8117426.1 bifunctional aspartate transaminase/aspartate 4-decarboxylase [Desulfarculaceae bacterium]
MAKKKSSTRAQERKLERLSPFQLKNRLIQLATTNHERMMLNAGRGNPNWTATEPRQAFFSLGQFAAAESERTMDLPGMGGHTDKRGMIGRFDKWCAQRKDQEGVAFLRAGLSLAQREMGLKRADLLAELVGGILADNYPTPDRMLSLCEVVVRKYLDLEMCAGKPPRGKFDLFATEGGTAAMCYIFNSLAENKLLHPGDKIALGTPIFTPYLEIPHLNDYELVEVEIMGDEHNDWQVPEAELAKLADPKIKAFFLVNPSNPPSVSMAPKDLRYLAKLVKTKRQDLIILTDDVYGTFVDGFRSLMATCPKNTICVYSFSKYFGCTGWRLGVIAIHQNNVFDKAIAALSKKDKKALNERYGSVTLDVPSMKLIDRMVADSRAVALNHTAGLSTPQQVQMALFALQGLLDDKSKGKYKAQAQAVVRQRYDDLYKALDLGYSSSPYDAHYYTTIDVGDMAEAKYGKAFAKWLMKNHEPVDFVLRLAAEREVVLLPGAGFDAPDWTIRVSLANLPDQAYVKIGKQIKSLVKEYYGEYLKAKK